VIKLFDISGGKVIPSEHVYVIPRLKKIMELYPDQYLEIYSYLFYTTCPDSTMNPYVNQPEDMREEVIIADLGPTFSLDDKVIEETRKWCEKMYETPTLRSWRGAKKMLDKVGIYLAESEITDGKDGNGMQIDRFMSKLGDYHDIYKKMDNEVKEEQAKVRGSAKVPYWQKPSYVDKKKDEDDDNTEG